MVLESITVTGSSKLELRFDLVVRLHYVSMRFKCNVCFIHVAGNCMNKKNREGLYRGNTHEGIIKGETMLSFIPQIISPGQVSGFEQVDRRLGLNAMEGGGGRGPAQDVPFFYRPYHLSELKSFKLIISTHFTFTFMFK